MKSPTTASPWMLALALGLMLIGLAALAIVVIQGLVSGHASTALTWVGMIAPSIAFALVALWLIIAFFRRRTASAGR